MQPVAVPWLERLARFGFAAKGVMYLTAAALAVSYTLGNGGSVRDADARGALDRLLQAPLGRPLLALIALALAGHGLWRIIEPIKDVEHRGRDAKGLAKRIARVGSGLLHLALAGTAISLALYQRSDQGHDEGAQRWTARALELPAGRYVVFGIAAAFLGYGLYQIYNAITAKLDRQLDLSRAARTIGRWVITVSRFGIAARGLVFAGIGVLISRAANTQDPAQAGGSGKSMSELAGLGFWPFLAIAVGLGAYGIYELLNARYRRVRISQA
jgi:hypothetical protein